MTPSQSASMTFQNHWAVPVILEGLYDAFNVSSPSHLLCKQGTLTQLLWQHLRLSGLCAICQPWAVQLWGFSLRKKQIMFAVMLILWALQGKSSFHLWLLLSLWWRALKSHAKIMVPAVLGIAQGLGDNPAQQSSQSKLNKAKADVAITQG